MIIILLYVRGKCKVSFARCMIIVLYPLSGEDVRFTQPYFCQREEWLLC